MVTNYRTFDTILQSVSVMKYYTKEELKVKKHITCICEIFVKFAI